MYNTDLGKQEKMMKVYLRFKDGTVRRAHFKIIGDIMTFRVKVSSEGESTETYLTEEEFYILNAGGMITVDGVDVVRRKFASLDSL